MFSQLKYFQILRLRTIEDSAIVLWLTGPKSRHAADKKSLDQIFLSREIFLSPLLEFYCLLFSQILRDAGYFLDGDFFSQYYVLWISEIEKYMMKRKQDEDWMIHLLENAQFFREPTKAIGRRFQFGDMKNPSSMR